jgi:hypothetical protein
MENRNRITIETFCRYHEVEENFLFTVQEVGLIQLEIIENKPFIPEEKLSELERIVRLHRELEINPEGIGAVLQLLGKIESLQKENQELKNRLKRFGF